MSLYHLGNRIRAARQRKGYTQEQLAEKIDVSLNFISLIENGRNMSVQVFSKIVDVLDVSADYLLGNDSQETIDISSLTPKQKEIILDIVNEYKSNN